MDTIEKPNEKLTEAEYIEKLKRAQADFENFRRRTENERRENIALANAHLITQLLEVLDNLELAIKHTPDPGVKLVYNQLFKILEKQGITVIDTNIKFNPTIHEAIITEHGDTYGVMLEEIKKGYMLKDKLIRASKIRLSTLE